MESRVIFLSERESIGKDVKTLATIYQLALAMVYPSFFEGFGIPVLEALWSKTPVITSNVSCLPETGGNAAFYVDPSSAEEISQALVRITEDENLREDMIGKGTAHAQNFTLERCTRNLMDIYKKII
jgi:glycosyltransferase involved in cell wall biosynthesis